MKLEAAAGLKHLCWRHPKPQYIYHYHMQRAETGRTRSPVLTGFFSFFFFLFAFFILPLSLSGSVQWRRNTIREGVLWVWTCQEAPDFHGKTREGKVPCLVGGAGHTDRHTRNKLYSISHTNLPKHDPVNCDMLIFKKKTCIVVYVYGHWTFLAVWLIASAKNFMQDTEK